MFAGAFLAYFLSQSPATRRAQIHERFRAYVDHPAVTAAREALPNDVRAAFDHLIDVAKRSTWGAN